jgi:peptidylprolyl isomerase
VITAAALAAALAAAPAGEVWRTADPANLLLIETTKGRILIEMRPELAPRHVEQVKRLAREGVYDGLQFHRVIDGFVAQTGNPNNQDGGKSALPDLQPEFTYRRAPDDGLAVAARPAGAVLGFLGAQPIQSQVEVLAARNEDGRVSAWGWYCPGVVGAGRGDDEGSANSEFFLMRAAAPRLNKRYTVWGKVLEGQAVVTRLTVGEPPAQPDLMRRVRVVVDLPPAERPKVQVLDSNSPAFAARLARERQRRGADFSICDVEVPVRVE